MDNVHSMIWIKFIVREIYLLCSVKIQVPIWSSRKEATMKISLGSLRPSVALITTTYAFVAEIKSIADPRLVIVQVSIMQSVC